MKSSSLSRSCWTSALGPAGSLDGDVRPVRWGTGDGGVLVREDSSDGGALVREGKGEVGGVSARAGTTRAV
ncbi:hypothetical protein [Roseateles sp. MS654]|uniref:hypothetical protein n=1 Tax=Roseateles sp. MS654 TaxID=3412685 RepID=UPI003C2CEBF3